MQRYDLVSKVQNEKLFFLGLHFVMYKIMFAFAWVFEKEYYESYE